MGKSETKVVGKNLRLWPIKGIRMTGSQERFKRGFEGSEDKEVGWICFEAEGGQGSLAWLNWVQSGKPVGHL